MADANVTLRECSTLHALSCEQPSVIYGLHQLLCIYSYSSLSLPVYTVAGLSLLILLHDDDDDILNMISSSSSFFYFFLSFGDTHKRARTDGPYNLG